jgi:hypothetical protein
MNTKLNMIKFEVRNKSDEFLSSSYCHRVSVPPGRFIAQKRVDGHYCEMLNIRAYRIIFETDRGFTVWTVSENWLQTSFSSNNN